MRKTILAAALAAIVVPAAPALADPPSWAKAHGKRAKESRGYGDGRNYDRERYASYYDSRGNYSGPSWRGDDGRYYCRRSNGTTGLLIGGVAGALAGRAIDTRGERATGTILGAVGGALIGREIDRSGSRCN